MAQAMVTLLLGLFEVLLGAWVALVRSGVAIAMFAGAGTGIAVFLVCTWFEQVVLLGAPMILDLGTATLNIKVAWSVISAVIGFHAVMSKFTAVPRG